MRTKADETSKLLDVAKYLPWMKRVCRRKIVLDQLDELEGLNRAITDSSARKKLIEQIRKDVVRMQP